MVVSISFRTVPLLALVAVIDGLYMVSHKLILAVALLDVARVRTTVWIVYLYFYNAFTSVE
jgi:hypothetical protein